VRIGRCLVYQFPIPAHLLHRQVHQEALYEEYVYRLGQENRRTCSLVAKDGLLAKELVASRVRVGHTTVILSFDVRGHVSLTYLDRGVLRSYVDSL